MKIDFDTVIEDFNGKELVEPETKEVITFRRAALGALSVNDAKMNKATKMENYAVAMKICGNSELTIDDAKKIKDCIGEYYSPLVYGRCCDILENSKE